ncbi:hypothetical protein CLOP_g10042 [Closterium sp. NIES-67]|nr:hypothetical protein CLOP_g10042 [Closterium sp. NIES-67]
MGPRSGLLFAAALAALILSACAPVAEAIRVPSKGPCRWGHDRDESGKCADTCAIRNCGANSKCLKDEVGWANCVCLKGFQRLPNASCAHSCRILECGAHATCVKEEDSSAKCVCNGGYAKTANTANTAKTANTGCVDTCTLKACVGGKCSKDVAGAAVCTCDADAGLKLLPDGRTCKDACLIRDCVGEDPNSKCVKARDVATCECNTGFELSGGVCTDKCKLKGCVGGTCSQETGSPVCHCDNTIGLVLLEDKKTCKDACEVKVCAAIGVNGECIRNPQNASDVHCACKNGYVLLGGICTEPDLCAQVTCKPNSQCVKGDCMCNKDFVKNEQTGECISDLDCSPDGKWAYRDGMPFCEWASPCGSCPSTTTCAQMPSNNRAYYCSCPASWVMTSTGCWHPLFSNSVPGVQTAASFFIISDPDAPGFMSRPYTFYSSPNACTQLPAAVAGKFRFFAYIPFRTDMCGDVVLYHTDNCERRDGIVEERASSARLNEDFMDYRSLECIP